MVFILRLPHLLLEKCAQDRVDKGEFLDHAYDYHGCYSGEDIFDPRLKHRHRQYNANIANVIKG